MDTKPRSAIRVLIADDHPLFREAVRKLLESDPAFQVVAEVGTGREAVAAARELSPDIVLLDLLMPDTPGLAALPDLARLEPRVRTLVLSAEVGDADVVHALQLGARGVVLKHASTELLLKAIRSVVSGEYWIGRAYIADLIDRMRERVQRTGAVPQRPTFGLTPRQLEIASAIVEGATNQDIAQQFSISAKTVKYHLTNMFDKLGVSNRVELARFAVKQRLEPTLYHR
ncbi:MAG TPA: response regulator transcription factor [Vicinamibacterales bacterium]|nr:response regulator transcription factor [Vicinamibacterales bacterium]